MPDTLLPYCTSKNCPSPPQKSPPSHRHHDEDDDDDCLKQQGQGPSSPTATRMFVFAPFRSSLAKCITKKSFRPRSGTVPNHHWFPAVAISHISNMSDVVSTTFANNNKPAVSSSGASSASFSAPAAAGNTAPEQQPGNSQIADTHTQHGHKRRGGRMEKNVRKKEGRHFKRARDWRIDDHPGDDEKDQEEVHAGSYANPMQRERFNKHLSPDIILEAATPPVLAGLDQHPSVSESKERDNNKNNNNGEEDVNGPKKRKFALLLGYLGSEYSGFQMNKEQATVQAELELALVNAKLMLPSNFGCPRKYGWSTSGRTDKGVHACGQVVSCKLQVPSSSESESDNVDGSSSSSAANPSPPPLVEERIRCAINAQLPSQVQVLDVVRTTRNFCAKTQRHRVRYQYLIPSFLLQDLDSVFESVIRDKKEDPDTTTQPTTVDRDLSAQEIQTIQSQVRGCRVTTDQFNRLRAVLHEYQGTHPFHNFTSKMKAHDARAKRYIESFDTHEPILFPSNDDGNTSGNAWEWIPTTVVGQSFLLHQIRKMIGLAVCATRETVSSSSSTTTTSTTTTSSGGLHRLKDALSTHNTILTPRAPAQGLFLDMSYYDGYNRRKSTNQDLDDIRWDDETNPAHARHRDFRNRVVQHIAREEEVEGNFLQYMYHEYVHRSKYPEGGQQPQADAAESSDSDSNSL